MPAGRGIGGFRRMRGRNSGKLASASLIQPTVHAASAGAINLGSAQGGIPSGGVGSGGVGPYSPSLGPFAGVAPPDILELDAWMHRENWNLGRLKDKPTRAKPPQELLDALIDHQRAQGRDVRIVVAPDLDTLFTTRVTQSRAEILIDKEAWRSVLMSCAVSCIQDVHAGNVQSYRGVPVVAVPF